MWFDWKNPPRNALHFYDGMTIVSSVACQKTQAHLWRLLLICFIPNRVHSPSKVHTFFDNYAGSQTFSVEQTKRLSWEAGEGKRLHIGSYSQEMPQGDDYKNSLKNNINKSDLISPPFGLPTGDNIGERSVGGIVNWSPESSCNQKKADTCIMYHCTLEGKPTSVISLDTDILIVMVQVFTSRLPDHDWFLQTKKNHFVNVSKM